MYNSFLAKWAEWQAKGIAEKNKYICPVCKNAEHPAEDKFCVMCRMKIEEGENK